MEFGIVTKTGDAATGTPDVTETIFCTHQHSPEDATPLHMVSAEQVAYWIRIEAEYLRLLEKLERAEEADFAEVQPICGTD